MAANMSRSSLHSSCQQQPQVYDRAQRNMAALYEELSLQRAKYQLLVEQCKLVMKPPRAAPVETKKQSDEVKRVLKPQNAVSASKETLIESPQQHRDLQLLEEVLEKARKIRISQPDQQTAARKKKRTERSVKQAEAVYKPVKKQSQRTSHSGAKHVHSHNSSSYRKTAQTRQPTVNTRNPMPKPPTSSTTFSSSSSKCHSQARPAVDVTPPHTVLLHPAPHHHLLEERKREDSYDDTPETIVVRHTERRQKGAQLVMPAKYRKLQQLVQRTNEHFRMIRDEKRGSGVDAADHFFSRFSTPEDNATGHTEQLIQLTLARDEHKLVAEELNSIISQDLVATEKQPLEKKLRMKMRLDSLTAPIHLVGGEEVEEERGSSCCLPDTPSYSTLEEWTIAVQSTLGELRDEFEYELIHFCTDHVLPRLSSMNPLDPQFIPLLRAAYQLCGLTPPVFINMHLQT